MYSAMRNEDYNLRCTALPKHMCNWRGDGKRKLLLAKGEVYILHKLLGNRFHWFQRHKATVGISSLLEMVTGQTFSWQHLIWMIVVLRKQFFCEIILESYRDSLYLRQASISLSPSCSLSSSLFGSDKKWFHPGIFYIRNRYRTPDKAEGYPWSIWQNTAVAYMRSKHPRPGK